MKKLFCFVLACVVAAGTMVPMIACNSQSALNDVQSLAPVITDVLLATCPFLPAPAPDLCATGGAALSAAESRVFTLWQAYITAEKAGTATPSAWTQLNVAMRVLINNAADVFALVHVVDPAHQTELLAMAGAAQALLAVVESLLPNPPAGTVTMAALNKQLTTKLPAPNPKTGKYDREFFNGWKKNWNSLPAVRARKMQVGGSHWFTNVCIPIGGADCSS